MRHRLVAPLLFALGLAAASSVATALAQSTQEERAVARALFDEGIALMKTGDFARAATKLEASQKREPRLATLLNLGLCYGATKRNASAWAAFREAVTFARATNDPHLADAEARVRETEPKVAYLVVDVPPESRVPGLAVTIDGRMREETLWGTPIPTDEGRHALEATAPGRMSRSETIEIEGEGTKKRVVVPPLAVVPAPPVSASATASSPPPPIEAPPPARAPETSSAWRTAGFVIGGAGVAAAIAGGALMAIESSAARSSIDDHDFASARSKRGPYDAGVATLIVGGVLAATGVAIVLAAPEKKERAASLRVVAPITTSRAGLAVEGTW